MFLSGFSVTLTALSHGIGGMRESYLCCLKFSQIPLNTVDTMVGV